MVIVNQNLGVGKGLKSGRNPRFSAMELPLLARRVNNRRLCFFLIAAKARQRLARVGGIRVSIVAQRLGADFAPPAGFSRIYARRGGGFAAASSSDSRKGADARSGVWRRWAQAPEGAGGPGDPATHARACRMERASSMAC